MNILIDECVPWPIHKFLTGHRCQNAQQNGWAGIQNGDLLRPSEKNAFDLFITSDQNIRYQQNLSGRRIAIIELSTNRLHRINAAAALIKTAIDRIGPSEFLQLHIP